MLFRSVLWSWRTFAAADRLALSIVAHQLGQAVFIPSIAMREAEERYRRDLETIVERFERTQSDIERSELGVTRIRQGALAVPGWV